MKKFLIVPFFLFFFTAQLMAADYYWVKGTGIWSDLNHWATTSGGGIYHFTVPTANDNVFFDANSFTGPNQVVTITYGGGIANVVCQSMDWTGALNSPMFLGNSSQTLRIYGSLTFIPDMSFTFSGIVYFEATTSGNTVTSSGKTFNNDVVFQGTGGWTLQDDLTTSAVWQLRSGSLSTNGKTVQCNRFSSTEGNVRGLNIANSLVKITGYSTGNNSYFSWDANGTGLTFNSVNSSIVIEGGDQKLNHTGTSLQYNNVKVLSGYYAYIHGGSSRFNIIQSGDPLDDMLSNAPNSMSLYSVHFADSIISYSREQNNFSYDSVNYVRTTRNLNINSGGMMYTNNEITSFARKVIIGKDAIIQSNNKIDSLWVLGNATINQNSIIQCDSIFGDGTFNGSSRDYNSNIWQVNQKNDFGRLVVMGNSRFTGINEVEHAVLRGNGTFENFNTIDSLYLSPRKMYQFGGGQTTTINKVLSMDGSCTGAIILQSTVAGVQAILHKTSGAVIGNYISLRDIKAEGGPTFTANNSVDLGNNSGWTINTAASLSLYWVEGTGNWDDSAHWSFTSGGPGGACVPTAIDDVFFDYKSFTANGQTVTVNTGNAVCRNKTWAGAKFNPTLAGPSINALRIYGSLTFISDMSNTFSGIVYFEATTSGNTVTSSGKTFNNDVVFQGTGGWTLQDDLTTSAVWQLRSGSLSTNGKTVQCNRFSSTEGNVRGLNIANSLVKITGYSTGNNSYFSWDANGTGLTFNSVNSSIVIEGGDQKLNHTGTSLQYNNVKVLSGYYAYIHGGSSRFNIIQSGDPLDDMLSNAPNSMSLYSVHFADSIISYSREQNNFSYDSVNYVRTTRNLNINSGGMMYTNNEITSFARKVIIGKDAIIQSNNKIDSLWVLGNATINQNSIIQCDSIFGDGTFNGSSRDYNSNIWQVNQKNDFGRLVVMGNSRFTGINEVEHAVLRGNGTFENFNTIDSLYLSPRKMYQFGGGQTTTINKVLSMDGSCTGAIILQSTVAGVQAILHKTSGAVIGNYISLRDIKAEGGPTFTANNSVDLGNNSGWTINTAASLSLYWVEGTGNWDDSAHWSFTSGGPGGACVPTAIDDVFFDYKSFTANGQTVTVNTGNAVCRNKTWAGAKFNPTLAGPSINALRIYGSLTFISDMSNTFSGIVYFEATTSGNTVTSSGKTFNNDVVFQGTGGWTLQDDLTTSAVWQLRSGSLSTNGKTVQCNRFSSTEGNVRGLNIANSLVKITGYSTGNNSYFSWDANGTGLTFNSVNSSIVIEGGDQKLNHTGTSLQYNNVKVLSGYYAYIHGGSSRFNIIQSGDPLDDMLSNAPNSMSLYSVHFADSIISYSREQNNFSYDSVNYVRTTRNLNINSGGMMYTNNEITSFARKVIIGKDAIIQSNNKIDSLWVLGNATINQNSIIQCDSIFGDGTFNGSSRDYNSNIWQVNQKNDFGRLVVMGNSRFTGINEVEHAVLRGNGTFENFNTIDSLYLSPGRIYQIRAGDILKVNKEILIRGNNCFPIQLRSTIQGQRATIWKPGGIVSGDFLELRDIDANGGATFYAGSYSTNLGNNSGWIFNNSPGYVYGLGPDTQICIGESLSTINFNGAYSYLWQDGSTKPNYTITEPGLYWVEATYGAQCSHRDSINVTTRPAPVVKITITDPWICPGESVQLVGNVSGGTLPYQYSWTPSASLNDTTIINPVASPATTTNYIFIAISANGCSSRDTLMVNVATPVQVTLTSTDPTACNSPTGTASVTVLGGRPFIKTTPYTYEWNTYPVRNTATITGLLAGSYVATASDSLGCTGQATAILSDPGSTVVTLVLSTDTICSSNSATATASGADQYEFFVDGISKGVASSNAVLSLSGLTPGVYLVSAIGTQSICKGASAVLTLTVLDSQIVGGSITGGSAICSGSTSGLLTLSGHTGKVVKWQSSVTPFNNWTDIANTATTFTSGESTETTQFRAIVQSGNCASASSGSTTVTVDPPSVGGSVTGGTSTCNGSTSSLLTLSGHTGMVLKWQSSVSPFNTWIDINNLSTTYTSGVLTETTQFRAIVQSGVCASASSGSSTVAVDPPSVSGKVTGGTTICSGSTSGLLSLSGHTGTVMKWQSSVTPFSSWTDIAYTADTYTSGALAETTQFRAIVQSGSCASASSGTTTVKVDSPSVGGSVTGGTSICNGSMSGFLTLSDHIGTVLKWRSSVSPFSSWTDIENTTTTYSSGALTESTQFSAVVQNKSCATVISSSSTVTVNSLPVPTITGSAITCIEGNNTYTTEAAMTGYIWTVSDGGAITSGAETNSVTIKWNTIGAQTISTNYININGCIATSAISKTITVNQLPVPNITGLASVCIGTIGVTYTTEAAMTNYIWTVSSGGTITSGASTNSIKVTWNTVGTHTLSVNYTNENGFTASSPTVLDVIVNSLTAPTITGSASVFAGTANLTYTTEVDMTGYLWTISSGGTITSGAGTNSINVTWNTAGAQTVSVNYVNANSCTAPVASEKTITVNPLPLPSIPGVESVCIGGTITYSTEVGMTGYIWSVSSGGTIMSGFGTNSVTVKWNTLGIQTLSIIYIYTNGCSTSATVKTVLVNPLPFPTITGSVSTCMGGSYTYITEANMTGYTWNVSEGGTITGGSATNTITVTWNSAGAQQVNVNYINENGCTAKAASFQNVTVNQLPVPPTLAGLSIVCEGTSNVSYTTEAGMTGYTWIVSSGGDITTGATSKEINVTWKTPGAQTVTVNYTNASGCTAKAVTVKNLTVNPLPTPTINGQVNTCLGVKYNYTTEAGMSGYTWIVSPGGTITDGSTTNNINVTWNTPDVQTISVNYINANGCIATTATEKAVTVNQLPVPTINGISTVCAETTDVKYTTESGMSGYLWTISAGGEIIDGALTNTINVKWTTPGIQTVTVNYININGCTAITASDKTITVKPRPIPTILGPVSVCRGNSRITYTAESAMTEYTWIVSTGGTIISGVKTNAITVVWNTIGDQELFVNYIDAEGCSAINATVQNVTVNPLQAPTISISDTTWIGSSYIYTTEADMTNYKWIVSSGGFISTGTETNSTTVKWINYGWQTLSINYINENGCTSEDSTVIKIKVTNPTFTMTEGISPNGDGINDVLIFKDLKNYPGSKLIICSRAGEKIYESDNYLNDWDAKFLNKGSKDKVTVLSGTYYYVLRLGGTNRTIKGFIYIGY